MSRTWSKPWDSITIYLYLLQDVEPERLLYLAVTTQVFKSTFQDGLGQLLLDRQVIRVIIFDPQHEVIAQWIPD